MGKFKITKSGEQYHFVLEASNGEPILSSEMYESKAGAITGIESIKANSLDDNNFERLISKDLKDYFILKAGNGEIIGTSETYESFFGMEKGIASVMKNAPNAITYYAGIDPIKEEE